MLVAERIQQYVQQMPDTLQAEVLDFAEYLWSKMERESAQQKDLTKSSKQTILASSLLG